MDKESIEAMQLQNQLCFPLYAAARKVVAAYNPFLRPLGLTYTQYILFLVLWEKDNMRVSDICTRLMLDSGTITPILKKLEAKNLIKRMRSEYDERRVYVVLTDEGRALQEKAVDIPKQIEECIALPPEKCALLSSLLDDILSSELRDFSASGRCPREE